MAAAESLLHAQGLQAGRHGAALSDSTSLVRLCADLIADYWECLHASGRLPAGQALSMLQWGAGTGSFAYRLLRHLRERLALSEVSSNRVRYAACDESADAVECMRRHPFLQESLELGQLSAIHVARNEPQAWQRAVQGYLSCPAAPLVVIANDVLIEAEQELVGFLDGKVFDGLVDGTVTWRARELSPDASNPQNAVLSHYAARLDNAAVVFPTGALRFIDACTQLSGGHYLLLAGDVGVHSERQLRDGAYAHVQGRSPVNFEVLSRYQRMQGALTWNGAADPRGQVQHVALRSPSSCRDDRLFGNLLRRFQGYVPGDLEAVLPLFQTRSRPSSSLHSRGEGASCEQLLAAVRISNDDPRVLASISDALLASLDGLTVECCAQWREAVERAWDNYFPTSTSDEIWPQVGTVAMHLGHWGVAKRAFAFGLVIASGDCEVLHRLSYCEASSGRVAEALRLIEIARSADPANALYREFASVLHARVEAWKAKSWYPPEGVTDGELTLEPLGAEHSESLLFQYRDPQIGVMTRLPEFQTSGDVLRWLEEDSREPGRVSCAVMHACWGFIGVVSMCRVGDRAYFYFWIGTDYQGSGWGQRAARLLLGLGERLGVRSVFTSAYRCNKRSRDALHCLGFEPLEVTAAAPDEDLLFFRRSCDQRDADGGSAATLRSLLRTLNSPIRLTRNQPE